MPGPLAGETLTPEPSPAFRLCLGLLSIALRLRSKPGATILVRNVLAEFQRHLPQRYKMLRTLIAFAALLTLPAFAQKDLPDGPGKQVAVRVCTGCHGAEMFSATRLGRAEWDRMIANMTSERGVAISDADYAAVLKYLVTYLSPPKANVNQTPDSK